MKKKFGLMLFVMFMSGCLAACGKNPAGSRLDGDGVADGGMSVNGEPDGGTQGNGTSVGGEPEGSTQGNGTSTDGEPEDDTQGNAASVDKTSSRNDPESGIYVFTDDLGREVTVSMHGRVAALLGSYADLWVLAGGELVAAPDDAFEDFGLTLAEDTINLGGTKSLSLELLLSADPDFVLASTNTIQHLEWQEALSGAGIPVAYFDVACFEDYLRVLKICTDLTGQEERYEQYGAGLKTKIEETLARVAGQTPPSVLFLRASATSIRAKGNEGNVLGEMLSAFSCTNIADVNDSLLENLSIESIALQDPDKLLILPVGDDMEAARQGIEEMFAQNPLWGELTAVKNGQVYYLDKHLFNLKPNARWAEAYEELAQILY